MIRVLFHSAGDDRLTTHGPAEIQTLRSRPGWLWIDIGSADKQFLLELVDDFGVNDLAVEDALTETHYPKVDDYGSHAFVVLHGIAEREGRLGTAELDAVVGERFLITIHHTAAPSIDWVVENATAGTYAPEGPDEMLARIAEMSARRFLPLIDEIDDAIDRLEPRAISGEGSVVPEVQALRRDTINLRRVIGPQREVLLSLSRGVSPVIGERARLRFASVYDHHFRLVETLDSGRSLLALVLDSYRSTVAEKMNDVMKVLTVYAAILLPLSLLAGIYGTNFVNLPELQWRWGYFGMLVLMVLVAVGQWVYFARRGFVGGVGLGRLLGAAPRVMGRGLVRLATLPIETVATIVDSAVSLVTPDRDTEPTEPPQAG